MPDLLLELFSEEIPARMQERAAADLRSLVEGKLSALQLSGSSASTYVTPRRLARVVEGLPERQPDREEDARDIAEVAVEVGRDHHRPPELAGRTRHRHPPGPGRALGRRGGAFVVTHQFSPFCVVVGRRRGRTAPILLDRPALRAW